MKPLHIATIIVSIAVSSYGMQKHFHLDSLAFGTGVDLDSGTKAKTDPCLRQNPYIKRSGPSNDSTVCYDIAWAESGLLWCFCDAYDLFSFFPSYEIKVPLESIRQFTASDTSNPVKAAIFGKQPDSMHRLNANQSGSTVFLVKTNKKNWAIVKAVYCSQSIVVCNPPSQNCITGITLDWWLQDDGSLSFSDLTAVKGMTRNPAISFGKSPHIFPSVNLQGQRITIDRKKRASSLERLKRGVIIPGEAKK